MSTLKEQRMISWHQMGRRDYDMGLEMRVPVHVSDADERDAYIAGYRRAARPGTMKALTIRQPWAWLIVNGYKDVENRKWSTNVRGPIAIHAGAALYGTAQERETIRENVRKCFGVEVPPDDKLERGGIVGMANLTHVTCQSSSMWFKGPVGFVLQGANTLPFRKCKGQLGFFDVEVAS